LYTPLILYIVNNYNLSNHIFVDIYQSKIAKVA